MYKIKFLKNLHETSEFKAVLSLAHISNVNVILKLIFNIFYFNISNNQNKLLTVHFGLLTFFV